MLILPLKAGIRYDLSAALAAWLDNTNNNTDNDPARITRKNYKNNNNPLVACFVVPKPTYSSRQCRAELLRLQGLRHCLTDAWLKPNAHQSAVSDYPNLLQDCMEYHAVVLEFEKQGFPVHEDDDDDCDETTTPTIPIQIGWKEAFPQEFSSASPSPSSVVETHSTLVWERACVAYNAMALLSSLIATLASLPPQQRNRDDCKQAVSYCQQGASIAFVLREICCSSSSSSSSSTIGAQSPSSSSSSMFRTIDLSQSLLTFWEHLFVAEAQGFILDMASISTTTAPTSLAVLSQSVHELYAKALPLAQDARLQSSVELPKEASSSWGAYCKARSMEAAARAEYHQSVACRLGTVENNSRSPTWGLEIAYLRDGLKKFRDCRDFCKDLSGAAATSVASIQKSCQNDWIPLVTDRLHEADADNLKVYHDVIPTRVPNISAKQLANRPEQLPVAMLQSSSTSPYPLFSRLCE